MNMYVCVYTYTSISISILGSERAAYMVALLEQQPPGLAEVGQSLSLSLYIYLYIYICIYTYIYIYMSMSRSKSILGSERAGYMVALLEQQPPGLAEVGYIYMYIHVYLYV